MLELKKILGMINEKESEKMSLFDDKELMVSIQCLVYNHEPYLRECLDGFVMQKTNFRFEAIVHDDCSTDGSAAIIREYAEKYPDIIKPIFETENQYSKHDGSLGRIMDEACKGKYIALCEGDDYWIDPTKLQKQVDFLESHPDYTMIFTNAKVRNDAHLEHAFSEGLVEDREYETPEIFKRWIVPTASAVVKREMVTKELKHGGDYMFGDIVIWLQCAEYGKVRGMKDETCVYRISTHGVTQASSSKLNFIMQGPEHYTTLMRNFPKLDRSKIRHRLGRAYFARLEYYNTFSTQWWHDLFLGAYYDPFLLISHPLSLLKKRLGLKK